MQEDQMFEEILRMLQQQDPMHFSLHLSIMQKSGRTDHCPCQISESKDKL